MEDTTDPNRAGDDDDGTGKLTNPHELKRGLSTRAPQISPARFGSVVSARFGVNGMCESIWNFVESRC